jgi:predicted TIM-barrel fold metal-dependent hydrolase
MRIIVRLTFLMILILPVIGQNCAPGSRSSGSKIKSGLRFYSVEDFTSVLKFDSHIHYNTSDTAFVNFATNENFHFLNIVDDRPFGITMQEQLGLAFMHQEKYSGRMFFATTFPVRNWDDQDWQEKTLEHLKKSFLKGAVAVKIWKNIGMDLRNKNGEFVMVDDPQLDIIYDYLAKQGITLIGHNGEPRDCWLPLEQMTVGGNRNYYSLHPEYHMYLHPEFPSYQDQINARDNMLAKHPDMKFIGCHLGSLEWSLDELAKRLDRYPNMAVDLSRFTNLHIHARKDWQKTHDFFIKYQDRLIYGTDRSVNSTKNFEGTKKGIHDAWLSHWIFFATDQVINVPEAGGEVKGLHLPADVIDKIYYKNAVKWLGL